MVYKIKLAKSSFRGDGLRVVEIYPFNDKQSFCFTIAELLEVLRLWIIGEEIKYPKTDKCMGRWMLYEQITKVFNNKDLIQDSDGV